MSTDQNKALLNRWVEAWNTHDLEQIDRLADEIYAADSVYHNPGIADLPVGPAGVKQLTHSILTKNPNARLSIDDMIAEGDRVASRWTITQMGPATGDSHTTILLAISRFVDGKIAEEWELVRRLDAPNA